MFQFLSMINDYEERKVGRYEKNGVFVSTAYCNDSKFKYETAIRHKSYSKELIIVENYKSKKDAVKGHDKWVKLMVSDNLPDQLQDMGQSDQRRYKRFIHGNAGAGVPGI